MVEIVYKFCATGFRQRGSDPASDRSEELYFAGHTLEANELGAEETAYQAAVDQASHVRPTKKQNRAHSA